MRKLPATQRYRKLKTITLDEFVVMQVKAAMDFREFWKERNFFDPENFPKDLPYKDWFEHLKILMNRKD